MYLHSVFAIVAWAVLLCTAAPMDSDLSHRSIPFTGVSHPHLFSDATHKAGHRHTEDAVNPVHSEGHRHTEDTTRKEGHRHIEVPTLERDVEVEEASCFCPGPQKAVHYDGKCQCIDSGFGKRDIAERDVAGTEEATCFCPGPQKAVHYDGKCQCIDNEFGKRDIVERDVASTEKAPCLCPVTKVAVHYDGKCRCIDNHFGKRDVALSPRSDEAEDILQPTALVPELEGTFEPGPCPFNCPANTISNVHFTDGVEHCTCQPVSSTERRKLTPYIKKCPTGCLPTYQAWFYILDGKRHCTCKPDNPNEFSVCPRPGGRSASVDINGKLIPCGDM